MKRANKNIIFTHTFIHKNDAREGIILEKDNLVIHYQFETEGVKQIAKTINQR